MRYPARILVLSSLLLLIIGMGDPDRPSLVAIPKVWADTSTVPTSQNWIASSPSQADSPWAVYHSNTGSTADTQSGYTDNTGIKRAQRAVASISPGAIAATYTITVTSNEFGTIIPEGEIQVSEGESLTLTLRPDPGYSFSVNSESHGSRVYIDGEPLIFPTSTYIFENVVSSHTFHVEFEYSMLFGYKEETEFNLWEVGNPIPEKTISPGDLEYLGAFRFPSGGQEPDTWSWATCGGGHPGMSLAFNPNGDSAGPDDGFPGSLFSAGHSCQRVAEITIPTPGFSQAKNAAELPAAENLQGFADIGFETFHDSIRTKAEVQPGEPYAGEAWDLVGGLFYRPAQGTQSQDRLYFSVSEYWGVVTQPVLGWFSPDLSNPQTAGLWTLSGQENQEYGQFFFEIPQQWADQYCNGYTLGIGRMRDGAQAGRGPNMYAIAPWEEGDPPANGTELNSVTLMDFGFERDGEDQILDGFRRGDHIVGAEWLVDGDRQALVAGYFGSYGSVWYRYGWYSDHNKVMLVFFDPAHMAAIAQGTTEPADIAPYAWLDISDKLFTYDPESKTSYVITEIAYDKINQLVYVGESMVWRSTPILPQNIVHVFRLNTSTPGPDKRVSKPTPRWGETVNYTIHVRNLSVPLTETVTLIDVVPAGLDYVSGTFTATAGTVDATQPPTLTWTGILTPTPAVTLTYAVTVTTPLTEVIVNTATIAAGDTRTTARATIVANGYAVYLPLIMREHRER